MNLEKITISVCELSRKVGGFIREEGLGFSQQHVKEKGLHDLVSYVDQQAEQQLVNSLIKLIPEAGFIAEENQDLKRADRLNWIIDPLDGTTNFIHGVPVFSISIALMDQNELIMGVVYEINLDECFYAWKGSPAYCNEKQIHVSQTKLLDQSLIATGFPYYDYNRLDAYMALFKELMKTTRGLRRLGSAAVDLAYVACGRFEVFYEYGLHPWDVAAGAFIVQQAGGQISDFSAQANYVFGDEIIATNKLTHNEFLKKLQLFFN